MGNRGKRENILTDTVGSVGKAYSFLEKEDELEINMYGEVVESIPVDWWTGKPVDGLYICEKDFLADLSSYQEKSKITVRINSVGGDLYAGLAIGNRLKELDAEIVTIADALCASAAVSIYQAGNTRKLFSGSQIMIHEPSCFFYGRYDVQGIKKAQKQLEAGKKAIIQSYAERTGRTEEELDKMITGDCWMTGQEAIEEGFADELIEGEVETEITEDQKTVISNGIRFPAEAFHSLPRYMKVLKNEVEAGIKPEKDKPQEKGGKGFMTKKELMENHPELYNEIVKQAQGENDGAVADAVAAERKRLKEIDEIACQVGDEKLVEEAKFGEKPMNASELALEAMKRQSRMGAEFLKNSGEDTENSGVNHVNPLPNAGTKSEEEQALQDIKDGAALIAGIGGQDE